MGTFSFKSSGTSKSDQVANALVVTPTPIGIKTPVALGLNGTDGLLVMNTDLGDQISDNLRNLILTNFGERLGFYDFGANLRPLMTDLVSLDDFDSEAISRIRNAIQRWMPYVDPQEFTSKADRTQNQHTAVILLTISYNVPALKIVNKQLQVVLYAI